MRRLSRLVFITLVSFLSNPGYLHSAVTTIPAIEREALIALYNSTDGDNWTNNSGWKEPPLDNDGFAMPGTEDSWYGITCYTGNIYVQYIDLRSNQLTGSIPPELGNLTNLSGLWLQSNQLTGSIPPELGSPRLLLYLYLNDNQLTGNIPPELGSPTGGPTDSLKYLYLNNNQLTGGIPPELGSLPYLTILDLHSNQLYGEIPTELKNLTWLALMDICDNKLYASDPDLLYFLNRKATGWEDCQGLITAGERAALIALYNSTDGDNWTDNSGWKTPPLHTDGFAMPSTENTWHGITCNAGNSHVLEIDLNSNELFGEIPTELMDLTWLALLDICDNKIYATDSALRDFLENLQPGWEDCQGLIPVAERAALIVLYNSTDGDNWTDNSGWKTPPLHTDGFAMPSTENTWHGITCDAGNSHVLGIDLNSNQLFGEIPTELMDLTWLALLDICDNKIYATDSALRDFLENLQPGWEDCQGLIPVAERAALIALYNSTDGDNWTDNSGWKTPPLHTDGFAMPSTENTWHGITCDAGNTHVLEIDLNSNELAGIIPPELSNLVNLQYLYLDSNDLTGSIPPGLGDLTNLIGLYLSSNQLTGSIPPELGDLANLQYLYLDSNQLIGSIPPGLGDLTNLQYLHLDSNQLTGSIPSGLGDLANLQWLSLSSNELTGSIPPQLGSLANLEFLHLDTNQLTEKIPMELMDLSSLSDLDICDNHLYVTNPDLRDFLDSLQSGWKDCQAPPYGLPMPWISLLLSDD